MIDHLWISKLRQGFILGVVGRLNTIDTPAAFWEHGINFFPNIIIHVDVQLADKQGHNCQIIRIHKFLEIQIDAMRYLNWVYLIKYVQAE